MVTESSKRILIVDDDSDTRSNLADILSDVGYETDTAPDGLTALQKIEHDHAAAGRCFDLCLLDFKMPGMDGAELYQRIRQVAPSLRAIMITAYAGKDGVQRATAAGTWKVLQKPVDVRSLLGLIGDALGR